MKQILISLGAIVLFFTLSVAEGKCSGNKCSSDKKMEKCDSSKCPGDKKEMKCKAGKCGGAEKKVLEKGKCGQGKCG